MDIFTQKRMIVWTIVLLVVLNLSTLTIIWLGQKKPDESTPQGNRPRPERTLELLQQELGFSDEQIHQYDRLRREHAKATEPLVADIRRLKKEMMDEIMTDHPDSAKVAVTAEQIGNKQAEIERLTFQHFLDLKALCGENQVKQLHMLVQAFFQRNPPPGAPGGPGGEGRPIRPPPRRNPNSQ